MKRPEQPDPSPGASPYLERAALPALHSPEPFTGADIIQEVPIGPAVLLCQAYRAVMLWAVTPPGEHAELFAPRSEEGDAWDLLDVTPMADDLRGALGVVRALIADAAGADPRAVAGACTRITDWALRREAPATAYRFAQAAGMCAGNDARLAYRAGCMARERSEWYLAKLWFRHAIAVGRRTRDWEGHAMGYVALGYMYLQQGRYTAARREQLKAIRIGKRHGLREVKGKAYHDLFLVAVETGEADRAEEYGQAAFRAYGPEHPAIPALAHDIAYFWNDQSSFSRALPVFLALLRHFHQPEDRVRVLASAARAAGGAGERATFEELWRQVWRLVEAIPDASAVGTSLVQLVHGAVGVAEWEYADYAARRALDVARERGETEIIPSLEGLLASVSARSIGSDTDPVCTDLTANATEFVADLVASLSTTAAPF